MEKRLYEAALEGDVSTLKKLIQEDPLILERSVPLTCFDETSLHVAVLRGHLEFARALLSHNPKLDTESDSLGRLPLHVATVKGHVEIIRELLLAGPSACLARDKDGKAPLYLAIEKGARAEVVRELTRASPESTQLRLERGGSFYHLCVMHNNLEALKVLMEELVGEDDNNNTLNARDDDGNTVFHLAALHKNLEMIKYLVSRSDIEANAENAKGLKALNLVENCPRDLKGLEVVNFLLEFNAKRASNSPSLPPNKASTAGSNARARTKSKAKSWKRFFTFNGKNNLEEFRGELFIVSTVIVAIAVLPVINAKSDGSLLDDEYILTTLSLISALSIMLLLVSGLSLKNKFCVWLVMQLMYTALGFLGWDYLRAIISDNEGHVHVRLNDTVILMCVWFGLLIIVSVLNSIRLIVLVGTNITSSVKRKLRSKRGDVSSNV